MISNKQFSNYMFTIVNKKQLLIDNFSLCHVIYMFIYKRVFSCSLWPVILFFVSASRNTSSTVFIFIYSDIKKKNNLFFYFNLLIWNIIFFSMKVKTVWTTLNNGYPTKHQTKTTWKSSLIFEFIGYIQLSIYFNMNMILETINTQFS